MGVPAFFRWLSQKYPKIITDAICERGKLIGEAGPGEPFVDTSRPNPSGFEFDNLYLDMNGIIHPCCHPESGAAPPTEEDMVTAIFGYVDHVFSLVRPRKLLFLAIDGVAPRAKMNQQRSRRFRAAQDAREAAAADAALREDLIREGRAPPAEKPPKWDSNVITPGTVFMEKVTAGLKYYVNDRLARDPGWRGVKVVLTTAAVPGEGEHKIMDFIRRQRAMPGYDPNTRHCIYGLDADLIMLALATHEPHFSILREVVFFGRGGAGGAAGNNCCFRCGQPGHKAADCPNPQGVAPPPAAEGAEQQPPGMENSASAGRKPFQFLRASVLREYLEHSFGRDFLPQPGNPAPPPQQLPFPFEIERVIDDFVFLCFFVGNDFLPHMPTLEIREGAIDMLTRIYKQVLPKLNGYITRDGEVNVHRALVLLAELAKLEDTILQKRRREEQRKRTSRQAMERRVAEQQQQRYEAMLARPVSEFGQTQPRAAATSRVDSEMTSDEMNFAAAQALKTALASGPPPPQHPVAAPLTPEMASTGVTPAVSPAANPPEAAAEAPEPEDDVRLGDQGWHGRYYSAKFGHDLETDTGRGFCKKLCESYMEGLIWVLRYYYQGCCSWTWFYPFHYSPFALDLVKYIDYHTFKPKFDLGQPFRPFEQLMGVLPAASAHALPEPHRALMTEPDSPIADFYPLEFAIDLNGKKFAWQGVAILPFIDEKRLLEAVARVDPLLTDEERRRNSRVGYTTLFVPSWNPLAATVAALYLDFDAAVEAASGDSGTSANEDAILQQLKKQLDSHYSGGLFGTVSPLPRIYAQRSGFPVVPPWEPLPTLPDIPVGTCFYEFPAFPQGHVFRAKLLPSAMLPPRVLDANDLWILESGGQQDGGRGRFFGQNSASVRMVNQAMGPSPQYHEHRNPFAPPVNIARGPQAIARVDAQRFAERGRESRTTLAGHARSETYRTGSNFYGAHQQPSPPPGVMMYPPQAQQMLMMQRFMPQVIQQQQQQQQQQPLYPPGAMPMQIPMPMPYPFAYSLPPQQQQQQQPQQQQLLQPQHFYGDSYARSAPPPPPPPHRQPVTTAPPPQQQQAAAPFPVQILQRPQRQGPPSWLAGIPQPQPPPPPPPRQ